MIRSEIVMQRAICKLSEIVYSKWYTELNNCLDPFETIGVREKLPDINIDQK